MKIVVVLTFEAPEPEDVVPILKAIDPPHLPHFANTVRVVIDPHASMLGAWLDGDEDALAGEEA